MAMEQERVIPTAESLTVEFKSDQKGPLSDKELVLAAICLANNQGGDLYLGVEDDGTVTGLHPSRDRSRDLAAVIASRTNPPLPLSATRCHPFRGACSATTARPSPEHWMPRAGPPAAR
jgi:predicted HTH transcriptional regulator